MRQPIRSIPRPIEETLPQFEAALDVLLRTAMAVGKETPGSLARAQKAREEFNSAVDALRRSERKYGRDGACSAVRSAMMMEHRSLNARGPAKGTIDYSRCIEEEIEKLKQATW